MIRHCVMVRLNSDVSVDQRAELADGLRSLCESVPGVLDHRVELDAGLLRGNHDLMLVADFADEDDLKAYLAHPRHQELAGTVLVPLMRSMAVMQHHLEEAEK